MRVELPVQSENGKVRKDQVQEHAHDDHSFDRRKDAARFFASPVFVSHLESHQRLARGFRQLRVHLCHSLSLQFNALQRRIKSRKAEKPILTA
jgi:hypothetical protein